MGDVAREVEQSRLNFLLTAIQDNRRSKIIIKQKFKEIKDKIFFGFGRVIGDESRRIS
jgi:hypothetical protein